MPLASRRGDGLPNHRRLWSLAGHSTAAGLCGMAAWFLRVIQRTDGGWDCRHGHVVFDGYDKLQEALEHLRDIAATMAPAGLLARR
jgi:hypothetical protein